MTAKEKNRLAGIFLLAHGGLQGLIVIFMLAFMGLIMFADPKAPFGFFAVIMAFFGILSMAFVVPQIVGGWKMFKERPDAKNWGIAGAITACMNAPLGTAAGVFALIFLFGDEGKNFYDSNVSQAKLLDNATNQQPFGNYNEANQFQAPPQREPHSWK